MREEISFDIYIQCLPFGLQPKATKPQTLTNRQLQPPKTILNPWRTLKQLFHQSSAAPTTSHLPSKWVLEESLPHLMIFMMTCSGLNTKHGMPSPQHWHFIKPPVWIRIQPECFTKSSQVKSLSSTMSRTHGLPTLISFLIFWASLK